MRSRPGDAARSATVPSRRSEEPLRAKVAVKDALAYHPRSRARPLDEGAMPSQESLLTPRERVVAGLVAEGLSNAEIAESLGIAQGTVKVHMRRIMGKWGCANRTQVAMRVRDEAVADVPSALGS